MAGHYVSLCRLGLNPFSSPSPIGQTTSVPRVSLSREGIVVPRLGVRVSDVNRQSSFLPQRKKEKKMSISFFLSFVGGKTASGRAASGKAVAPGPTPPRATGVRLKARIFFLAYPFSHFFSKSHALDVNGQKIKCPSLLKS